MSANTNYYDILGVSKNASPDELKKAYRKAAIMNHSDKGGDPEKFKELAQAYDVLSDPVKRYQYGVDALKDVIGGGGGGSISGLGQTMAQDVAIGLLVSLERLYNGISQDVIFFRNVICSMCKGTGETITCKDPCQQCKGEKVVEEKKVLEVHIEKGMQTGETITFPGEDLNTRGFVFIIQEEEHPKFKRIGDDLIVEHTLSLTEALCGFQFELTHLDNRQLIIKSEPGEVVKPDQYREINNEGMPMYQKPFMRGKLYIHFTVDFPDSLTPDQSKGIEALLPRRTLTTADCELTDLVVETATCPRGV